MNDGRSVILRGDARSLPLADASVDLIVTSPPYFALRSYTDGGEHYAGQIGDEPTPREYIAALIECTREWVRVLKPGGSMWINLGDKYAGAPSGPRRLDEDGWQRDRSYTDRRLPPRRSGAPAKSLLLLPERYRIACVDEVGLIVRAVVIWSKPNGLPESVTDRVRRSHEDWVHLVKLPHYFSAVDEIREPYAPGTAERYRSGYTQTTASAAKQTRNAVVRMDNGGPSSTNPLGKLPGSVWTIPTEPLAVPGHLGVDHFAAFPTEWPRRIIQAWSPVGGVVLDPFGGTGTTALVAAALGRVGISVDRSADYCRLATWRTTDPGQLAKARRLPKPKPQAEGQGDLFADLLDGVA